MKMKRARSILRVLLLLTGGLVGSLDEALVAETSPPVVSVPEDVVAKNVPPIPQSEVEGLLPYENLRTAIFIGWHPRERRLLIHTRFAETLQLHEVAMPMGARTQLTFLADRVYAGNYRPTNPDQIIFGADQAGNENFQIYLLDRKSGRVSLVTDGKSRHLSPVWSQDGRFLAYVGNARNGRDFDIYLANPGEPGSERRVAEVEGYWNVLAWSPDGLRLLLRRDKGANDSYLYWVDVKTGELHSLTPTDQSTPISWRGGRWSHDGRAIYTLTNLGSEFLQLVRLDVASGKTTLVSGDIPWDVEAFDLSDDESVLAFFVNVDGVSELRMLHLPSRKALRSPTLPSGLASSLSFRPGSHEIAFTLSWARSPSDVYSYDPDASSGRLERWTASEIGGLNAEDFSIPQLIHYPTFDETAPGKRRTIPAFVYHPSPKRFPGRRPVFIEIHGGPEIQVRPSFIGNDNYLINELGVAFIQPNVRGSTGYGKTYHQLDNGTKREDSVKDIGALLDWIATQPDLDSTRVMVSGGSYGGYVVLASLVSYSDRLRGGHDSFGISNFVSYLTNTQEYRRDLRRVEYGDERDPAVRAMLERISPMNHATQIKAPLLVAQGANDPRVPLSESDQIVDAVERNGVPVWYVVAKNEGHGFSKKVNEHYLQVVLCEFVKNYLLGNDEQHAGR